MVDNKVIYCSNCGNEIERVYYVCSDNFLQAKYFDTDKENIFCSHECFCEYLMLDEIEIKDDGDEKNV